MISTAQKHSMDTHELLFEDKENKLTYAEDMIKTLNEILVMRGDPQSDELPTFCRAEHFHQVRYALDWVRRKADDPRQLFTTNKLVCIEDFVLALSQRFDDVNSTIDEIEEHMATRHFDCTPQTNCAFHEARSNPNCALGEARSS